MSEYILKLQIDIPLIKGDPKVVNLIASGHSIKKNETEIYYYSLATKYCSWHNKDSYAIYDSFVEKLLLEYHRQDKFSSFSQPDLKDFPTFLKIVRDFMNFYELSRFNLKEIDKFLWIYGQELF